MIKYLIRPNYFWMTAMQVTLPVWLYFAWGASWTWWLTSFVFYFLYLCVGNNIGMHRFYSHRYFDMYKPVEYFVAWCSSMACLGSPLSYVSIHNVHHRYNDTALDPHGPTRGWRSILFMFHRHITKDDVIPYTKNLTRLIREYSLLHDYYWIWVFGFAGLIYAVGSWNILLFCWLLPSSITLWIVAGVLLLQHDTNGPSNTRSYMLISFGETWHANHHADPKLIDHSQGKGIDWTYRICKILSKSNK